MQIPDCIMRTAIILSSDPTCVRFYENQLQQNYIVKNLRHEKDLIDIADRHIITLIIVGADHASKTDFDISEFTRLWSPKACIIYASAQLPNEESSIVLSMTEELIERKPEVIYEHRNSRERPPSRSNAINQANRHSPDKSRPVFGSILKTLRNLNATLFRPDHAESYPLQTSRERVAPQNTWQIVDAEDALGDTTHTTPYPTLVTPTDVNLTLNDHVLNGFLLGQFEVRVNGVTIDSWPSRKGKSLAAYLLFHRDESNLRDLLMERFWPNVAYESARNSLNVALHGIRKSFKQVDPTREYIIYDTDRYRVNPEIPIQLDCETFMDCWQVAQRIEQVHGLPEAIAAYERAARLYSGDFIEGELFDEWICTERETILEAYLFTLDRLSAHYAAAHNYKTATTFCERILTKDDCRENVHRRLMRCYYHTGRRDRAIRQYHKCVKVLNEELEVTPSRMTVDLYEKISRDATLN